MKIFVSFDFDNDRQYKYTLNMWASNANIDFSFNDRSYVISEIPHPQPPFRRMISMQWPNNSFKPRPLRGSA